MTIIHDELVELDFPTPDPLIDQMREIAKLTVAEPMLDYEAELDEKFERIRSDLGLIPASPRQPESIEMVQKLLDQASNMMNLIFSFSCVCTPGRGDLLRYHQTPNWFAS